MSTATGRSYVDGLPIPSRPPRRPSKLPDAPLDPIDWCVHYMPSTKARHVRPKAERGEAYGMRVLAMLRSTGEWMSTTDLARRMKVTGVIPRMGVAYLRDKGLVQMDQVKVGRKWIPLYRPKAEAGCD